MPGSKESPNLYPRFITPKIEEALTDTPVVLISGPRQSGKTTLARQLSAERTFLTLDNEPTLRAAQEDPVGLVRSYDTMVSASTNWNTCRAC